MLEPRSTAAEIAARSARSLMLLISTLGGLEVFGFNGFVIGPVIAALFMATWEIFAASRAAVAR